MGTDLGQFRTFSGRNASVKRIVLDPESKGGIIDAQKQQGKRPLAGHKVSSPPRLSSNDGALWSGSGHGNLSEPELQNRGVRHAFATALQKAYGPTVVAEIIPQLAEWKNATLPLSSRHVGEVVNETDKVKKGLVLGNSAAADKYIKEGHLGPHLSTDNRRVSKTEALGFEAAFRRAVASTPDYGARELGQEDLKRIAGETAKNYVRETIERFDRTYPALAGLRKDVGGWSEREFFEKLQEKVDAAKLGAEISDAIKEIRTTTELLGRTPFNLKRMREYKKEADDKKWYNGINVLALKAREIENSIGVGKNESTDLPVLLKTLKEELENQAVNLDNKATFAEEYLLHDPRSEKSLAGNAVLWARAGKIMIGRLAESVGSRRVRDYGNRLVEDAVDRQRRASPYKRIGAPDLKKLTGQQKLDVINRVKSAYEKALANLSLNKDAKTRINRAKGNVAKDIDKARLEAMNTVEQWKPITRKMVVTHGGETRTYTSVITPASATKQRIGRLYRSENIHGVSAATKDNETHARNLQVSTLTDGDRTLSRVVRHGVLDPWKLRTKSVRQDAAARQVDEVMHLAIEETSPRFKAKLLATAAEPRSEPKVEPRSEPKNGRSRAEFDVVTTTSGERVRQETVATALAGPTLPEVTATTDDSRTKAPAFEHVHVNLNLTTPVDRFVTDYAEGSFTGTQFEAFENYAGNRSYTLDDRGRNRQDVKTPEVRVDAITFSYGVNELALGPAPESGSDQNSGKLTDRIERWGAAKFGGAAWKKVDEHNEASLVKLIGNLGANTGVGGVIGRVLEHLEESDLPEEKEAKLRKSEKSEIPEEDEADASEQPEGAAPVSMAGVKKLGTQIREQVEMIRDLHQTGAFRENQNDPYKMPRHLMRLVGLAAEAAELMQLDQFAITQSQGCKSGKDRGGMADVEHKAQVIIEDMGGRMLPATDFSAEDRTIYNTVLTSSGQAEVQRLNTGLPGSKNAKDVSSRIADDDAQAYSAGLGGYVKA